MGIFFKSDWRMRVALGAALLLPVLATPAWPAPVPIGRASTETPADQKWRIVTLPYKAGAVPPGAQGPVKLVRTMAVLASGRSIYALLLFEGSEASDAPRRHWAASCEDHKTSKGMFVRNRWLELPDESRDDCVVAIGPIQLDTALRALDAQAAAVAERNGIAFDATGYVIKATVAHNGSALGAWLLARDSFKGSELPLAVPLGEARLPAPVAQWGIELAGALHAGVESPSGKFTLPRIDFLESANRVPVYDPSSIPPVIVAAPSTPTPTHKAEDVCPNAQEVFKSARYPSGALAALLKTGTVLVEFTLTADGEVTDVRAVQATDEIFAAEAVATVKRLKCSGQGKRVRVRVPFGFRLEG